ncbi:hypothetical protein WJX81_001001 [Elliptochloris bilobata]|uniref:DUF7880 domain-containing protein n=1 Tax=Elliptochloris bilobata TaxID=381761 RepID=A0AAW1S1I8_9CHLO
MALCYRSSTSVQSQIAPLGSERLLMLLPPALLLMQCRPPAARAQGGLSRYIKKRRLEPLENYVPAVVAAREQLVACGSQLDSKPAELRKQLRNGAFLGVRENIRAVGEWAAAGRPGDDQRQASQLVAAVFSTLQGFDQELDQAAREGRAVALAAGERLAEATAALDALLATVPEPLLERAQHVAAAVAAPAAPVDAPAEGGNSGAGKLERLVPLAST